MDAGLMFDGLGDDEIPMDCIESPFYVDMRALFNEKLAELLMELDGGEFSEGDIALKLTIGIGVGMENVPQDDYDAGGQRQKSFEFKKPGAEWEARLTLKKTSKDKGQYQERRAFKCRDGRYIAIPVKEAQVSIDEYQKRRGQQ